MYQSNVNDDWFHVITVIIDRTPKLTSCVHVKYRCLANHYRIYSPISRFAYKSDAFFEAIFEGFAFFSPISRYHFLSELVDNFRSMNCCLY